MNSIAKILLNLQILILKQKKQIQFKDSSLVIKL